MLFIQKFIKIYKWEKNNNKVFLITRDGKKKLFPFIKELNIIFNGSNNTVSIYAPVKNIRQSTIRIDGNNSEFIIKSNCTLHYNYFSLYDSSKVEIGDNFTCYGGSYSICGHSKLTIGNNCLFSNNLYLRTDDGHTIIDKFSHAPLNSPNDINIGNHVWVATKCSILKGSKISDNSIVALGSVVNKKFETENCLLGGVCAKIIKTNISWDNRNFYEYVYEMEKN